MALTLYTNPMSRGRIARWMLEEVGAPYETVSLGFAGTMKAAEYLAINPMGKVPAIRHDATVVTEVAAICAYLADTFPDAGLAPPAGKRGAYYRWMFFAAGPIEQAVTNRSMGFVPDEQKSRMSGYGSYDKVVEVMQAALTGREWIADDAFTAADVVFGAQIVWGTQFGTIPKLDPFVAYAERLTAREGYKRAAALDDAAMHAAA